MSEKQKVTMDDALARLIRIMGTFDLATGHADTMDQALDALEAELRDVLGHLRAGNAVILNEQAERIAELEERVSWLETTLDTVDAALGKWRDKHRIPRAVLAKAKGEE